MDATTEAVTAELRSLLDDLRKIGEAPWVWYYEPGAASAAVMAEVEKAVQSGETRMVVAPADQRGVRFTATTTMEPILSKLLAHLCGEHERAFLLHLLGNRLDGDTAAVFADWLEEHGRTEAGDRVRLLRPRKGDLLVMSIDRSDIREHATWEQWEESIQAGNRLARQFDCQMILLSQSMQLNNMDADAMRKHGWVRAEEAERRVAEEREACARVAEQVADEQDRDAENSDAGGSDTLATAERIAATMCRIVAERVRNREGQTP